MLTASRVAGNEAGFRALFMHATVGILIVDSSGTIVHANPFLCGILGYAEEELAGKEVAVLLPRHLRDRHRAHIHAYFKDPVSRPMGAGVGLVAEKQNGEKVFVEIGLCSYSMNDKRLAVAFVTDITARISDSQMTETKTRFVSLASHEFRTPLSTILSSATLIARYNGDIGSEHIAKHISRIKNAVSGLTHILDDFLSLDKLEQGAVAINPINCHLPELIEELCDDLEHYLKPGQLIRYTYSGEDTFFTDKTILKSILLNLLSNASKYSGEKAPILLSTSVTGTGLRLEVTDQGIGIPKKELDRLFSLFYRGSNVGTVKGTGLGLNIVTKYLSLLAGKISVSSIENAGTTFIVTIPPGRETSIATGSQG